VWILSLPYDTLDNAYVAMKWIPGRDCVVTPHNPNNSRTETRRAPSIFLFHICLRKLAAIRCTPNWLVLQCHIGRVVSDAPRAVHLTSYQTINGFTPPSFPHSFRSSPPVSFDVSFHGFLLLFCPASLLNSPYQVPLELTVVCSWSLLEAMAAAAYHPRHTFTDFYR